MDNSDTLGILQQLERGEITPEEANVRLEAPYQVERMDTPVVELDAAPNWVRQLWVYPLISGLIGVGIGAWIIVSTVHANALWFVCGLPILLIGALVLALAATARAGHWLYVNIQESSKHKRTIRFAIPFPLGLVRMALWFAKIFVPDATRKAQMGFRSRNRDFKMDWADADAFLDALERELVEHRGVKVDVDDNGERVQVYIV
jgi:hypothetical protein